MKKQQTTAALYDRYVLGNYGQAPLTLVEGQGTRVRDSQGKDYLDFTMGIAVNALGHCHPRWVRRVQEQAATLAHVSNLFRNEPQAMLAERLCSYAGEGRVFFCNSGAEANEALLKLARLYGREKSGGEEGKRYKVICAEKAFHGRTFGSMSATPQEKIQGGFRPMLEGFAFGELNNVESFAKLIDDQTAAIFLETIQGESGVNVCSAEFLQGVRELCDKHGILMMLDEVQCGLGRTGRFYAFEHMGVKPDAIGMAKGLGGGFPIGAVWMKEDLASLFKPGSHGTTFGGTPLACAASLATIDVIEQEDLMANVRELAPYFHGELERVAKAFPEKVVEVRGIGFMVALALKDLPQPLVAKLREKGLLCPPAGGNAIRFLPPLNVSKAEIDEAIKILEKALGSID